MSERHVSVLKEYWKCIENLRDGEAMDRIEMPPWEEICHGLDWNMYKLDHGSFGKKRHGFCGVYRLVGLMSDEPYRVCPISRACGEDHSGTLYVGEAGWLHQRLNQLRRSLHGEDTHGATVLWRQSDALRSKFPSKMLGVGVLFTSVRMHGLIERDLMRAYLSTFGDTPPLNCSF